MESFSDILRIWRTQSAARKVWQRNFDYYEGRQRILNNYRKRFDDKPRSRIVTNWIEFIVQQHVGFLTSREINLILREEDADRTALEQYVSLRDEQRLSSIDSTHLKHSLIAGHSIEVHGYENDSIVVREYDPREWAVVLDYRTNEVVFAVHRGFFDAGDWYDGSVLETSLLVWSVYDSEKIYRYVQRGSSHELIGNSGEVELEGEDAHSYGRPPVIVFRINKERRPIIRETLIEHQDAYNETRSDNFDDVQYNVDSFLALYGYSSNDLLEKDEDTGQRRIEILRELRMLPMDLDAKAEFLNKGNSVEKVSNELSLSRDAIHLEGFVPDLHKIIGSSGEVSGIALKLKFEIQRNASETFIKYFKDSIRERIALLNRVWSMTGKKVLENYEIKVHRSIPVNESEIRQDIPVLRQIMSREDVAAMLPSVEEPERLAEARRKEIQREEQELGIKPDGSVDSENNKNGEQ